MIGHKIIWLDKVDSTNLYLNNTIKKKKIKEGLVVTANEQTAGKGQMNTTWESESSKNILISFVLYPHLQAVDQFLISKCIALGIHGFIKEFVKEVKIKWPNDIYVGNKKISGILIENSLRNTSISNSIVGAGININQIDFSSALPNPTSLKLETKRSYEIPKLIILLLEKLNIWYNYLNNNEFDLINGYYKNALYQLNNLCMYRDKNGSFKAKIIGVDEIGRLCLIDINNQLRKYSLKEIDFL